MSRQPIRVLHVVGKLEAGGAESFIMSMYRNMPRDRVQFDFVANDTSAEETHAAEVLRLGGRIFRVPRFNGRNVRSYRRAWAEILRDPSISLVHVHHTSTAMLYLDIVHRAGLKAIAHSHTAGSGASLKDGLKRASRSPIRLVADELIACSPEAAAWMFGDRAHEVTIMANAIEAEAYAFSTEARAEVRESLALGPSFVVGHVGRFSDVKNHLRLVEIFRSLVEVRENAVLLLVGDGELRSVVDQAVVAMGLSEKVRFLGRRSDVAQLMSAMDVFALPSHYEGFPVSLVEAQASGLPCVVADGITRSAALTNHVQFVGLDQTDHVWARALTTAPPTDSRTTAWRSVVEAGFDAVATARTLEASYRAMAKPQ